MSEHRIEEGSPLPYLQRLAATPLKISEAGTVQFPMVKHAAEIGWTPIAPEVAKQKRGGEAGMMLRDELEAALNKFNPWMTSDAIRQVIEKLEAIPPTIEGNRDMLAWLRGERTLRVLLAYDFTPQADAAALFAARLAALGACQPIAAFVDDPARESGRLGLAGSPARAHDHLRDEVAQRLARILPNLPIEVVVSSHEGDPSARLVHLAEREQADLVIVGSNQRGAIGRLFAGSVALDLLRDSATNVIVVPGAALPPVTQIAPVVRKVLVATDLSSVGNRAIEYAMAVAPPESEIVVVHVVSPNLMRGGRYGRASYRHFAEEHAEVVAERQQALDTLVAASARAGGAANARAELLESAEVERTLLESIERHAPDLVCIGTTGRSGIGAMLLGSTAQAVLRGCRRPLLLVQPQDR